MTKPHRPAVNQDWHADSPSEETTAANRTLRGHDSRGNTAPAKRRATPGAGTARRPSRTDEVQQRIKQLILERGLAAGEPMPTELELLDEINVSRNSLREALKALQAVGIVEIRHGFGMYVGTMSLVSLVDELTFHGRMSLQAGRNDLRHLVQIREVLEFGLIQQVIQQNSDGTPPVSEELTAVMDRMEAEARAGGVSTATDKRFHELLYEPLGNPLVTQLLSAFWDVYHALHAELDEADESPAEIAARHRRVFDAVRAGDVNESITALTEHFSGIRRRLSPPEHS
ncbi:FadR/GntR family transcriptional regulator [Actinoplanes sp. GCM10030250]|uniref:FadR/GntR family transcriptional regulator n=1 Tax=Actinoplanes sp. GCM10030250 TaxID=3273376 RepID=UPI0036204D74